MYNGKEKKVASEDRDPILITVDYCNNRTSNTDNIIPTLSINILLALTQSQSMSMIK